MKWLVWASFFHPHVGGYERNVLELCRRLVERGEDVVVIACNTDGAPKYQHVDGVAVLRLPCWNLLGGLYPVPKPSPALVGVWRTKADVGVTQTRFFPLSLLGAVHAKVHGAVLVHVERGTRHTAMANPVLDIVSRAYDHVAGRWITRNAAVAVGVSNAACDFARHIGAHRVIRIPNGVGPEFVSGYREGKSGRESGREREEGRVLYVGRLIWAKGVQDILTALGKMDGWRKLVVVGNGPYRRTLADMAARYGDRVEFRGTTTGERLVTEYRRASLFVNPSYSEGLPSSVMEAAAMGVPVVATDVGGTQEVIEDGVTGTLIRPGDVGGLVRAMRQVLSDMERATRMAEAARVHVLKEFSWDDVTDGYIKLIRRACCRRNPA